MRSNMDHAVAQSKKELERREKERKVVLVELEAKCKDGAGTKEDYIALAKMRRKLA